MMVFLDSHHSYMPSLKLLCCCTCLAYQQSQRVAGIATKSLLALWHVGTKILLQTLTTLANSLLKQFDEITLKELQHKHYSAPNNVNVFIQ